VGVSRCGVVNKFIKCIVGEGRVWWCVQQVHTYIVCEGGEFWCVKQVHTGIVSW
jgi:hypothetical protein